MPDLPARALEALASQTIELPSACSTRTASCWATRCTTGTLRTRPRWTPEKPVLTACGLPVLAGPVEAAALGYALVQARSAGVLRGGLGDLRALLRATQEPRLYLPNPGVEASWRSAEERLPSPS